MTATSTPSRRHRRRWWQYGLRSLLLFTLAAALVAKYLSRPEVIEESEPHGAYRIVRQVLRDRSGKPVNHGRWTMFDPAGNVLVEGAYRNGQPRGWWTYWHAVETENAGLGMRHDETAHTSPAAAPVRRRSMQGRYECGKREGTWTAWHSTGHKRWEIEFAADLVSRRVSE